MEVSSLLGYLILMVSISPCLATYIISGYRLISNHRPNAGIIELYNDDVGWGRVCPGILEYDISSEVCRQLNFPGISKSLTAAIFNEEGDVTNSTGAYYWDCSVEEMNIKCDTYDAAYSCDLDGIRAVTCKEPGYLGCFLDPYSLTQDRDRVFVNVTDYNGKLTIHLCIATCKEKGFFYAGVEYAYQCFCGRQGEVYDRHGDLSDGECNYGCHGDDFETCGGSNKIAVYQVGLGACDDPGTPTNGFRYNESDSLRYGSKLYFNCSDGYILEGPDVIQCMKTYGGGEDVSIADSSHAVTWNNDLPSCTTRLGSSTSSTSSTRSTVTTKGLAPTNQGRVFGTTGPGKQEGRQNIIYIGIGIASGLVIIVVIIVVVVARKRHTRRTESQDPAVPASDNGLASHNHGDGGDSPLVPSAHEEEDLFVLTELTSHSNTAGENHYTGGTDGGSPTQRGSADRPGISRGAFGYESIRLPSADSAPDGSGGTVGDDSVEGATDLYANTEFHDVPTNMIDNELYG